MRKFLKLLLVTLGMLDFTAIHAQVIYKISPASNIHISGTSTLSDWVVKSPNVSGQMTYLSSGKKSNGNELPPGTVQEAKAILEVASIKSEKGETMDHKMYRALKYEEHPQIIFLLNQPFRISRAPSEISASGNIDIGGVTHPITFDLSLTYADNAFHFQGSKSLKLSDFQIEPPSAMFGQIVTGDEIVVTLDLFFTK